MFLLLTIGRRRTLVAVWALGGLVLPGVLAGQFVTWGRRARLSRFGL